MSTEPTEPTSPFTRPRFLIAAVTVGVIVVLAVVLAVVNASRDNGEKPIAAPTTAAPAASRIATAAPGKSTDKHGAKSVCGLGGETLAGRLTAAPAVDQWQYQGTTAYPVSKKYGPGANDPAGFRYCFQHSPEGALFAAANAMAGSNAPDAWADYFVSSAVPNRAALLSAGAGDNSKDDAEQRISTVGFRLLQYTATSATVDLAMRATTNGSTGYVSAVLPLTWEDGDWKFLPDDPSNPFPFVSIPDTAGYIAFAE